MCNKIVGKGGYPNKSSRICCFRLGWPRCEPIQVHATCQSVTLVGRTDRSIGIGAATEAVRVCIKKAQMFSMDHTSMSSSSFRSSSRSWAVSFSSFKKAATSLPAEP